MTKATSIASKPAQRTADRLDLAGKSLCPTAPGGTVACLIGERVIGQ